MNLKSEQHHITQRAQVKSLVQQADSTSCLLGIWAFSVTRLRKFKKIFVWISSLKGIPEIWNCGKGQFRLYWLYIFLPAATLYHKQIDFRSSVKQPGSNCCQITAAQGAGWDYPSWLAENRTQACVTASLSPRSPALAYMGTLDARVSVDLQDTMGTRWPGPKVSSTHLQQVPRHLCSVQHPAWDCSQQQQTQALDFTVRVMKKSVGQRPVQWREMFNNDSKHFCIFVYWTKVCQAEHNCLLIIEKTTRDVLGTETFSK